MSKQKIFFIAFFLIACFAKAQLPDTLQGNLLNEVIITANKTEQKQSTTGKIITVITKQQIENSGGKTVAEILNEQAGVVINGAFNSPGTVQTVYMRGAGAGRTLILLDGIPMSDPSNITNDFDLNFFSVNDIERIEICKGAQSTLYGSDAIAGVINIITIKKNIQKPLNIQASAAGGSLGTFKGNMQLYGKSDKLIYSIRYAKIITNGFSAAYDSTGKNNFDNDGYNGNATNANIRYKITDNFMLKAFALYSQYKADVDAAVFTDDKYYTIHNNNFSTGVGFEFKNKIVSLSGNYQYMQLNRKYFRDSIDKTASTYFINNKYFAKTQYAEVYASIKAGSGFTFLQGGDFRWGAMNNQYSSNGVYGAYSSAFKDTSVSQASIYSSLQYNSKSNGLNAELGGRLNVHSRYGSNYTYTFNPSYNINAHARIFASVSSGFKSPGIFQLYDVYSGNKNLQPEKSVNYEVGLQYQSGIISQRLVGFYRRIKNAIDYDYIRNIYFNFNKQKVKGLEYEVSLRATKQFSINANYSFLSAKEETQNRINYKDTTYEYLLRRPSHNVNVTLQYQCKKDFMMSVSGKYVSRRYDLGGYDAFYNALPDAKLKGYFLLNAYAAYTLSKHLRFFADAQNITAEKFFDVRGYNSIPFLFTAGGIINF